MKEDNEPDVFCQWDLNVLWHYFHDYFTTIQPPPPPPPLIIIIIINAKTLLYISYRCNYRKVKCGILLSYFYATYFSKSSTTVMQ